MLARPARARQVYVYTPRVYGRPRNIGSQVIDMSLNSQSISRPSDQLGIHSGSVWYAAFDSRMAPGKA
jgi:hypothetical protein